MIRMRIPATSANMGAGFDSLGLAVSMYNHVNMELCDGVRIKSLDNVPVPTGESNLIYKTAKYLYDLCDKPLSGLYIEQESSIPMARGLGSSSACVVAGLLGANHFMGNPLSRDELIDIAAVMEGHPDNSTPALLGGQVTAVLDNKKVWYVKQDIGQDLRFVAIIPNFELKTSHARQALPKEITHKHGVFNLSRAALMAASLAGGNYKNLRIATQDKLHQPYRLSLIEGGTAVIESCYVLGAYGAYISGAGSTLMAIIPADNVEFESKLRQVLNGYGFEQWSLFTLQADNDGTILEEI